MPNRKRNTGWFLLRSGAPYYGTLPEGTKALTDAQLDKALKAHAKNSGKPAATPTGGDGGTSS